ncbi:hypothetical protein OIV83_005065 [Microbotryomycetes sp. JL201]|nr:hypothetical protein OIV83_005065 [Microbotryomycetes sp. JL201]
MSEPIDEMRKLSMTSASSSSARSMGWPRNGPPTSETRWGDSSALKLAVLLHGLSSASQSWCRIATGLVNEGYYVVAPDLLGHGFASTSESYTIQDLSNHVEQTLSGLQRQPDLIVGHSLGSLVACALPWRYKERPHARLVLIDPPFELSDADVEKIGDSIVDEVTSPSTVQQYLDHNPKWTVKDAVCKVFGASLCLPETVRSIMKDVGGPWKHTSLLSTQPPSIEIIVLGADPALGPVFTPPEAVRLVDSLPHVKTAVVLGTSHSIHREEPDVVLNVLLTGKVPGDKLIHASELREDDDQITSLGAGQV